MPSPLFTVSQAAVQLGVSGSSVRRIYDSFIASEDSPRAGSSRRLSVQDIEVIREVLKLKDEGKTPEQIREHLEGLVFSETSTESSQIAPGSPPQAITALAVTEALQSVVAPLVAAQQAQDARQAEQGARLQALEERQQATESQRPTWRDVIILVLAGVMVGLMIGLSIWWFQ